MKKLVIQLMGILLLTVMVVPGLLAQQGNEKKGASALVLSNGKTVWQDSDTDKILDQLISIDIKEAGLEQALQVLSKEADLKLMYTKDALPDDAEITLRRTSISLNDALWKVLKDTGLRFAISESGQLVLLKREETAKEIVLETVSGTVTDAQTGETLPGVNVLVKGTTTGTSTDSEGGFELGVPSLQDTLVFSFIGYQTQEVPINGRTSFDVALQTQAVAGEELVVIGYGEQRRADMSGSVSSVSGEDLSQVSTTSVDQALIGQTSGVLVSGSSGRPGSTPRIRIRGSGSIVSDNSPLYVIDGMPVYPNNNRVAGLADNLTNNPPNLLASLNPDDIESIEVLKDASATAIYGARGANGVVLITTKGGRGGDVQFNVDWYSGVRQINNEIDLLSAGQYAQLTNDWAEQVGVNQPYNQDQINSFTSGEAGTDWQDEVFRNAAFHNLTISASGGTNNLRYYLSANYLDENGIVIENNMKRFSLRPNLDIDVSDNFTVKSNMSLSYTLDGTVPFGGRGPNTGPGVMISTVQFNPTDPIRNSDGSFHLIPTRGLGQITNPVALAETQELEYRTFRALGSVSGEYNFTDQFSGEVKLGFDNTARQENHFFPRETTLLGQETGGQATKVTADNLSWLTEFLLRYNGQLSNNHRLNVVGGFTAQEERLEIFSAGRKDFVTSAFGTHNLSGGATEIIPNSSLTKSSLASFLGRVNYTLMDKYILTFTSRYDGSSRFGENNKWGYFPSGAVAWRLSEESFMESIQFISELKLRASYGITGNQEIGIYQSLPVFGTVSESFGGQGAVGVRPARLGNPNLTWEETRQLDIGLDASLFEDRLDLSVDYYDRDTEDLLLNFPLPNESGLGNVLLNSGEVSNNGVEFSGSTHIPAGEFQLNLKANYSFNNNEIRNLAGLDTVITGQFGTQALITGEAQSSFYSYDVQGIWQENEAQQAAEFGRQPGDFKYRDVNGDGRYTGEDRTVLGQAEPKYHYGFNVGLNYKGFDLNMFWQGAGGHKISNRTRFELLSAYQGNVNTITERLDYWRPENPNNTVPSLLTADPFFDKNQRNIGQYIEDGDYLRLKSLTLGYNFTAEMLQNLNVRSLRIYVSAQNLLTVTGYEGQDPEVVGVDRYNYPFTRSFRGGLNVGF
ncbi:SusC/RagA family TonB-linked outer membrane protein [Halalkalibaculum sp. DA384]|uniref:SusC/RagA family TonB-linked outer membrane protein n=1 Tax=Halalkalibaculum sp. DA384 TaxID=3373606 RepID=UPI00375449D8